ncbi:hypothetical protein DPMN_005003 [Dreissena polymorpha]|uniref:Uncharacterized protein n=1 Tax=Dreissena polymorpha TaxID=45954 RepID=A0A9D4MSM8_DREPO|nr:hypothetical protein DPMN_005003 [Dreissena polymorpha]
MPDSNIYQGDVVTFICLGDVGNNPVGTLGWYYYVQGDGTSVQNFTGLATPDSVHSNKTCSMTAVSMLTFKITAQIREFVVRCTVNQGVPFTLTGLGYKETPVLKGLGLFQELSLYMYIVSC